MSQENLQPVLLGGEAYHNDPNRPLGSEDIVAYVADRPPEYVPYKGIIVHIRDATYPKKGNPTPESVAAINIIKSLIKEVARHPIPLLLANKNKLLSSFNVIFDRAFAPYKIKEQYLCPTAYNSFLFLYKFLRAMGINTSIAINAAYNVAHILEYDDAYRYRLQDIASETSQHLLKENPRKELARLFTIFEQRTTDFVAVGLSHVYRPLLWLLLVPKVRRAFIEACPSIEGMKYDDADRYWAYLKDGHYNFGGLGEEKRIEGLKIPQAYKVS